MNVVLKGDIAVGFNLSRHFRQVFHIRTSRNGTEVLVDPFQGLHGVDITADCECGIVGAVPAQEETLQVVKISPVQILDPADHRPGVGVAFRIQVLVQGFQGPAVGLVIHPLAAFILHGFTLNLEFFLGHCRQQEAHAVGFQPQNGFQLIGRHGLEVVGAVGIGGAVQRATRIGNDLEMLVITDVFRALEQHVLEEMSKTGAARVFPVGTHMVGHIHVYQRIGMILVQHHGQAIVQAVLLVRNGDLVTGTIIFFYQSDARWQIGCANVGFGCDGFVVGVLAAGGEKNYRCCQRQ